VGFKSDDAVKKGLGNAAKTDHGEQMELLKRELDLGRKIVPIEYPSVREILFPLRDRAWNAEDFRR